MPKTLGGLLEYLQWFDDQYGSDITPKEYHYLQSIMCSAADLKVTEDYKGESVNV